MLKDTASILRNLSKGEDLSNDDVRKALNTIGQEDTEGFYHLALTFGIMAKKPTVNELYGFCQSFDDCTTKIKTDIDAEDITDVSGTGGDMLKTFNIGTTTSFVVAAAGLFVAKQSFRSFTGISGSIDIFESLGIPVPIINGDPEKVADCLKKTGIAPYYYPSFTNKFINRVKFIQKMREIGLTYLTPYHLVAFAYAPISMKARVYGVFDEKYLKLIAEVFKKLGLKRAMVCYGEDGIDEISNIGITKICELKENGSLNTYEIKPEDYNISRAKHEEIQEISKEQSVIDFIRIIYGKEKGPKQDIILMNAGASLYINNRAESIKKGIEIAESLINKGKASNKLEQLIDYYKAWDKLEYWKKEAKIT